MAGMKYMEWPQTIFHERNYTLAVTGSAPNAKHAFFLLSIEMKVCSLPFRDVVLKISCMNFLSRCRAVNKAPRHVLPNYDMAPFCSVSRSSGGFLVSRYRRARCFALNWRSQEASCVAFNAYISC